MTCNECRFYDKGICKRYPHCKEKSPADWCGEFKPPKKPIKQKRIETYSPEFDQFYEAYPKKKAPDAAWRAWQAIPSQHYPLVIERATLYAQSVVGKDMTYVKHPATWLTSGDWKEKAEKKFGKKDCSLCYAPYAHGHTFVTRSGKEIWKCAKCREKGKLF